jgi:DNA ligase-1
MLAAKPKPEELDEVLAGLTYPALYSPKLDGIRATVQNGRLYSRALKLIPNKEMQALWGREELDGLDGEIIVGPPTAENCFNRSTSVVMSRDKVSDDAIFHVFDIMLDGVSFDMRLARADDCVMNADISAVKLVKHELIKTHTAALKYEERMTKFGYEGIMRRDPNGAYKQGRSTLREGGLIAVKRFVDAEAVILDTYEQEENTNEKTTNELGKSKRSSHKAGKVGKDTLGGFTVLILEEYLSQAGMWSLKSITDNAVTKKLAFNIGTGVGLTDAVRTELWTRRKTLPGKIVKFRYQKIGTMEKPRLPVFLGFRDGRDL